jgi:M6 family metalloprotease-like protein
MRRIALIGLIAITLQSWSGQAHGTGLSDCALFAGANLQPNEGPTDEGLYLPSRGRIKAVMIFVDFPDAPASESTHALYDLMVPHARRWYREVSYGRLELRVAHQDSWYRMPRASSDYGFTDGITFEEHRTYILDAIAASDIDVDYSAYDAVYIVPSNEAAVPVASTFQARPGGGVLADGVEVRLAVTLGQDIRFDRQNYGANVLIHETGHLLGLPDLYEYDLAGFESLRLVGGWDVMSWVAPGAHFLLWHKLKLGWVEDDQVTCIESGKVARSITALEIRGGHKGVVVRTSPSTAYVIELRRRIGQDAHLCDGGVLIYTVDATVPTGEGPIVVRYVDPDSDPEQLAQCGPRYDAAFGRDDVSLFSDSAVGLTVEIIRRFLRPVVVRVIKE